MTASPFSPALRLARVRDALADGRAPDPADAAWLAEAITAYLERPGPTLDHALQLRRPGHDSAATIAARDGRDALLRRIAAEHFADLSRRQQAIKILEAVRRYEASAWRFDRHKGASPYPAGTRHDHMWQLLSGDVAIPRSARALQSILASAV